MIMRKYLISSSSRCKNISCWENQPDRSLHCSPHSLLLISCESNSRFYYFGFLVQRRQIRIQFHLTKELKLFDFLCIKQFFKVYKNCCNSAVSLLPGNFVPQYLQSTGIITIIIIAESASVCQVLLTRKWNSTKKTRTITVPH